MNQEPNQPIDPVQVDVLLQQWRSVHNTPEKVAAAHRKVLPGRVCQSMAFENQPVSMNRLKTLTATPKLEAS